MSSLRLTLKVLATLLLAGALHAQQLRYAISDASVVVTARHLGVEPLGEELLLHTLEVQSVLKGEASGRFTIIETQRIADTPRPRVDQALRLYCLNEDARAELPALHRPYFKLGGYRGESPKVDAAAVRDPYLEFARLLIASQVAMPDAEQAAVLARESAEALLSFALAEAEPVRVEAIEVLRTSETLRDALSEASLGAALTRATVETADLPLKISLASLCVEARMDGVIRTLCGSFAQVSDARYAHAIGRLTRYLHGEESLAVLAVPLGQAQTASERGALLQALGATRTRVALDELLRMRSDQGPSEQLDAALRAHGSKRALQALK